MNAQTTPEFRWLERGSGDPVILLHGLMGEMWHWEPSLDVLGDTCRAIAPSLPIFDPALPEVSVPELARHVVRLLDALEISHAVVGGNSLGGHVALELALEHRHRVTGVVLTGSSGLFERGFTRNVPHAPTIHYVRMKMEEIFYDPTLVTPDWVQSVARVVTTRSTAVRVVQFARAAKRHNVEAELHRIAVPTLLVWGKDDRITPPEVAERFHALIPGAELVFVTNCGHAPMLERPEAFTEIVGEWLRETSRGRAAMAREGAR